MAYIYFVDGDNGDDTKDGKSLANAWKTINKATQTMQAGDTTYVKPCTYREKVTFANSGADGSPISLIGDTNGEYFGIKGSVRITSLNSDEVTSVRNIGISVSQKSYIIIKNFFIDVAYYNDNVSGIDLIGSNINIENNIIYLRPQNGSTYWAIGIRYAYGVDPKNVNIKKNIIIMDNNTINTSAATSGIFVNGQSDSLNDLNNIIENNILINCYRGIFLKTKYYPMNIFHNLFLFNTNTLTTEGFSGDWKNQLYIYNNIFWSCKYSTYQSGNSNILSGNNIFWMVPNNQWNINQTEKFYPLDLSKLIVDEILKIQKDNGNTTYKVDEDIFGNPRPLIGGYDIGPIEFNSEPLQESTIKDSGSYSAKIVKADFKDFTTFLSSGEHTISVKVKWSDYTGANKPQLIIKQDKYCGIDTDQVATATGDGTSWETLSKTITLAKDAEITIRVYARDIGASALTYFDTINIT